MGKRGSLASLVPLLALELEERSSMCIMLLHRDVTTHGKVRQPSWPSTMMEYLPPMVVKGSLKK